MCFRTHRVIIASGSRYLLNLFKRYKPEELDKVKAPKGFNSRGENHSDDQVSRIMKYFYNSQDIYSIKSEINDANIFALYSQAYAL